MKIKRRYLIRVCLMGQPTQELERDTEEGACCIAQTAVCNGSHKVQVWDQHDLHLIRVYIPKRLPSGVIEPINVWNY